MARTRMFVAGEVDEETEARVAELRAQGHLAGIQKLEARFQQVLARWQAAPDGQSYDEFLEICQPHRLLLAALRTVATDPAAARLLAADPAHPVAAILRREGIHLRSVGI